MYVQGGPLGVSASNIPSPAPQSPVESQPRPQIGPNSPEALVLTLVFNG